MRRRAFIAGLGGVAAVAAWSRAARAQPASSMRRIGVLIGLGQDDPEAIARLAALLRGLETLGWSEGRNIRIDRRFAPAGANIQAIAKELVALGPDVIVSNSPPAALALQRESRTIPIVFSSVGDPIGLGLIANLARPGGNLTGLTTFEAGVAGKWLMMLKEVAPNVSRVGVVGNPKTTTFDYYLGAAQTSASPLFIELVPIQFDTAANVASGIDAFARAPNCGLIVLPDPTNTVHRQPIIDAAARNRLPAVYAVHYSVRDGGLMSYGTDRVAEFGQTATYIDRILRGAKPSDLPVQTPIKFETVINAKTAKSLGLTIPAGLLVRADEVIE